MIIRYSTIGAVSVLGLIACSAYNPVTMAMAKNPVPNTPETVSTGTVLFQNNCVVCHGSTGKGDGVAAKGMRPAPANLRDSASKPEGILAMRIARGGNGMPAWEGVLNETEIWQLARHIKNLSRADAAP